VFVFACRGGRRSLRSFPTRRSSDLEGEQVEKDGHGRAPGRRGDGCAVARTEPLGARRRPVALDALDGGAWRRATGVPAARDRLTRATPWVRPYRGRHPNFAAVPRRRLPAAGTG